MTDAHQTTASLTGALAQSGNTDTAQTVTVISVSGDLVIGHTASGIALVPVAPVAGVTELWDLAPNFLANWGGYKVATGTSTVIDATSTGFVSWTMAGIAYKASAGGGAVTVPKQNIILQSIHRSFSH